MREIRNVISSDLESIKLIYEKAFDRSEGVLKYYQGFPEYVEFCIKQRYAWNFQPDSPDGECNTIRFIFIKECFGVYELTDEAIEDMIEEAGQEMEFNERGHTYG